MNPSYDIIFCVLPPMSVDRIYSTPPVLKGIVEAHGYHAKCFDFVMDLFKFCQRDHKLFSRLQNYLLIKNPEQSEEDHRLINEFFDQVVETIKNTQTKYIGLSVFSIFTHKAIVKLLIELKKHNLTDKIVLGGRGLSTPVYDTVEEFITLTDDDKELDLFTVLKKYNLVTYGIVGDGEDAILDFLNQTSYSDTVHNQANIRKFHYPDYSDYNFNDYVWTNNQPHLLVTGSAGCVRNCDFCDVKSQFGNYRYKEGAQLANELIWLQKQYNINHFVLTDSLSNGGLKPFQEFLTRLTEHNTVANFPISWSGQYICRSELTHKKNIEQYYYLLKHSGAQGLSIGAESGSNRVLAHMDKKTTVEALFFELEYFRKYNITCQILTIPGHWSEQQQDFDEHCKMLYNLVPYVKNSIVSLVSLGVPFKLLPGTPASKNINIIKHKNNYNIWLPRNNRGNTYKTRIKRKLIANKLATMLRLPINHNESEILQAESEFIKNNLLEINNFFTKYSKDSSQFIPDDYQYIKQILNHNQELSIELELESSACNGDPVIEIAINGQVVHTQSLVTGQHTIKLVVPLHKLLLSNRFSVRLTNKNLNDTKVDSLGNIYEDKNIKFKKILFDNCDLVNDVDFFYQQFYIDNNGDKQPGTLGLWGSMPLCLDFETPFKLWYANTSNTNLGNQHLENVKLSVADNTEFYYNKLLDQLETIII